MTDFKTGPFMYGLAFAVIAFVIVQSLFFIVKAWKRGKELNIKTETLKQTVISSALFTIAPSIAILATVIVLASALGIVLPWIRLSVVGNLAYETVAAQTALEALGSNLTTEVTDPIQFSAVTWIMTIGISFGIFLLPFVCKRIHKKVGKIVNKDKKTSALADILASAAFIGIIAAFIAREINGKTADGSDNAGFLSICTLLASMILMVSLQALTRKLKLDKLEPFVAPVSMFGAMAVAILLTQYLPAELTAWTWWN